MNGILLLPGCFFLGSIPFRYLAVAALPMLWSLTQRLGYPPAAGRMGWLAAAVVCALVLVRHRGNFRRLRTGTEYRLGGRSG